MTDVKINGTEVIITTKFNSLDEPFDPSLVSTYLRIEKLQKTISLLEQEIYDKTMLLHEFRSYVDRMMLREWYDEQSKAEGERLLKRKFKRV